jgi:hypothetical protein
MTGTRHAIVLAVIAVVAVGCDSSSDPPAPPATLQSPGGNWVGHDSLGRNVNLVIAENGKVRAFIEYPGLPEPPLFAAGTVAVGGTDMVSGEMRAQSLIALPPGLLPVTGPPAIIAPALYSCSITGTVAERVRLTVQIACSTDAGLQYDESVSLLPQSNYLEASSLEAIAGNYAMQVNGDTNFLNISADGTIFGAYDAGAQCTINGLVSIIDARYSLLNVDWTLSACTDPFGFYEGAEYSGFATPSPEPGRSNSYYFMLVWERPDSMSLVSINYDPT